MLNNGFSFLWAEDTSARLLLIRHITLGRQLWRLGNLAHPANCSVTGQKLQTGWLCYYPPIDSPNSSQVIGEYGIRHLLNPSV
jgi:hypothetical protein